MNRQGVSNRVVKQINLNLVFSYVYENGHVPMKNISLNLNMSLPTVNQNLKELQARSLITGKGVMDSTGGRKARTYAVNPDGCFSMGLDITSRGVSLIVLNLLGDIVYHVRSAHPFENEESYYEAVGRMVVDAVHAGRIPEQALAGVGIAIPAIVAGNGTHTTNNDPLGERPIYLSSFERFIPYRCRLMNDANAGGYAEFWEANPAREPEVSNQVYLSVSDTVGGSIMIEGKPYAGPDQHSAEFGHMTLVPGGVRCYCGQDGCAYGYVNTRILSDLAGGELDAFFGALEGNAEYARVWDGYLDHLALLINNIRAAFDCDLIIGGYLGRYIAPHIEALRVRAARRNIFEHSGDYIRASAHAYEASAVGAALAFLHDAIKDLLENPAGE